MGDLKCDPPQGLINLSVCRGKAVISQNTSNTQSQDYESSIVSDTVSDITAQGNVDGSARVVLRNQVEKSWGGILSWREEVQNVFTYGRDREFLQDEVTTLYTSADGMTSESNFQKLTNKPFYNFDFELEPREGGYSRTEGSESFTFQVHATEYLSVKLPRFLAKACLRPMVSYHSGPFSGDDVAFDGKYFLAPRWVRNREIFKINVAPALVQRSPTGFVYWETTLLRSRLCNGKS